MTALEVAAAAASAIAHQNDAFRHALHAPPIPGRVVLTRSLASADPDLTAAILAAVVAFNTFTPDNDPYGEHDCACLTVADRRVIWKFDYFADASCEWGAEDPRTSYRVLTVMFGEDN